ncbi:MAG: outer membrane protein transport protein [bacterium]|nr:outer membrane protein transport protein [bacterium]
MNTQTSTGKITLSALVLAVTSGMATTAMAQGYQIDELSAHRLGDAFSGGAAEARDASTAHYNPAGLVRLKKTELTGGFSVLSTRVDFTGDAVTADPGNSSGSGTGVAPVSGGRTADTSSSDVVPHLYFSTPLAEGTVLGIALNAPFASSTDYGSTSPIRYQTVKSEVTGMRLTVSAGQAVSTNFSVGGGLIVQRLEGSLSNAIDASSVCSQVDYAQSGGGAYLCGVAGSGDNDGRVKFEGDDVAFGYTLGLLYSLTENTRAGFAYRSAIKHKLEGTASVQIPAAVEPVTAAATSPSFLYTHSESASFNLNTPESASASLFHQLSPMLSLQGDVTWTRWSRFQTLDITTASGFTVSQPQNWNNNWRFAVGGEYQASDVLAMRAGFALDKSPVPSGQHNLSFPLKDFKAVSVGMTYAFSSALAVDAGLQRTLPFKTAVNDGDVATTGSQANGTSETSTWSAALGFNWKP